METRKIGSLEVSVVGLGTNNFGGRIGESASAAVLDTAIDCGINFIDTADAYGDTKSEVFIGQMLGARRSRVVLATKFGLSFNEIPASGSSTYVRKAADDSLRRLQTDYIDLYIFHRPDPATPITETLEALGDLVASGKVREIGCSNFSVAQLQEAEMVAKEGRPRFVNLQNNYSLLHREPELGMIAECVRQSISFVPYYPLGRGLLTGKYRRDTPVPEGTRIAKMPEEQRQQILSHQNFDVVGRLTAFVAEHGHSMIELAFSWLLAQPAVASVIAGATTSDQVQTNAAAASWKLSQDDLVVVDQLTSLSDC